MDRRPTSRRGARRGATPTTRRGAHRTALRVATPAARRGATPAAPDSRLAPRRGARTARRQRIATQAEGQRNFDLLMADVPAYQARRVVIAAGKTLSDILDMDEITFHTWLTNLSEAEREPYYIWLWTSLSQADREGFLDRFDNAYYAHYTEFENSLSEAEIEAIRTAAEAAGDDMESVVAPLYAAYVFNTYGIRRTPRFMPTQNQGIAYQIHNVFDDLNLEKYKELIGYEFVPAFKHTIDHCQQTFTVMIEYYDLFEDRSPEERETLIAEIKQVIQAIGQCGGLVDSSDKQQLYGNTVNFVDRQSDAFIEAYLIALKEDVLKAYDGGSHTMSCSKGIMERLIFSIPAGIVADCGDCESNPVFKELKLVLKPVLINEQLSTWAQQAVDSNDRWILKTFDERKHDLIRFVREAFAQSFIAKTDEQVFDLLQSVKGWVDYWMPLLENNDELHFGGKPRNRHRRGKQQRKTIRRKTTRRRRRRTLRKRH